jgi:hypothetical protein
MTTMDAGRTIIDIGPAPGNAPPIGSYPGVTSEFYEMEQFELLARNYPEWIPVWGVVD